MATIERKNLLTADLPNGVVDVQQIELPPGQGAGLHIHLGPVFGYVASGTVRFQIDGELVQILRTGSAFFEPANTRIREFANASNEEPATFIAFYHLSHPDQERITMLEQ
ncbi:MAG TPA: cupin domain-containing protein [Gemmatimonadaceae bacterium]|nr:cupin domain-containing protein [Gemmatimonadaceae bacterium]